MAYHLVPARCEWMSNCQSLLLSSPSASIRSAFVPRALFVCCMSASPFLFDLSLVHLTPVLPFSHFLCFPPYLSFESPFRLFRLFHLFHLHTCTLCTPPLSLHSLSLTLLSRLHAYFILHTTHTHSYAYTHTHTAYPTSLSLALTLIPSFPPSHT